MHKSYHILLPPSHAGSTVKLLSLLPYTGEFKEQLCDEFGMVVSPLVYDLTLRLDPASQAAGWKILHAYGTPNPQDTAVSQDGTVMKVSIT